MEAFDSLRLPLSHYLIRVLGDAAEAEDLAQEAFLRLYADLMKGGKVENVRAWVFRVAHNLAIDRIRDTASSEWGGGPESEILLDQAQDPGRDPEQSALHNERNLRIARALRRLSSQERHCLELRAEGLRYREIGEVLDIHISSVFKFLERAMEKIAREVR